MKYCKKCFHNVREDVDVCPYCGAPGLTDYGSQNSGEAFTCSHPKELEREIAEDIEELKPKTYEKEEDFDDSIFMFGDEEEEDAYKTDEGDPYGNGESDSCNNPESDIYGSKRHTDENCENAPDTPLSSAPSPDDSKYKMRIEYLNMLKKIDGITPQRIDELMRRYDESHGNYTGKRTYNSNQPKTTNTANSAAGTYIIAIFVAVIFSFFNPIMGIIIALIIKSKFKNLDFPDKAKWNKILNIVIAIIIFITVIIFGFGITAAILESML